MSLRYILSQGVDLVIPGMQSTGEVEENAAVGDVHWALEPDELALLQAEASQLGRTFCRRCEYCQPCPQGIRISMILNIPSVDPPDGVVAAELGQVAGDARRGRDLPGMRGVCLALPVSRLSDT